MNFALSLDHDKSMFKGLVVSKLKDCKHFILNLHDKIGNFGEDICLYK